MNKLFKALEIRVLKCIWKINNRHNSTYLADGNYTESYINRIKKGDLIIVGKMTYGGLNVYSFNNPEEKLKIGAYCSIASSAAFLLSGEHLHNMVSTFPFLTKCFGENQEAVCKGPILLDDDVWIGDRALILSGVHIQQGAIVAAGSVVVNDVEPYSIVGGVPARHIKYRFKESIIKKLMGIDWNKVCISENMREYLLCPIDEKNVDTIINKIMDGD